MISEHGREGITSVRTMFSQRRTESVAGELIGQNTSESTSKNISSVTICNVMRIVATFYSESMRITEEGLFKESTLVTFMNLRGTRRSTCAICYTWPRRGTTHKPTGALLWTVGIFRRWFKPLVISTRTNTISHQCMSTKSALAS